MGRAVSGEVCTVGCAERVLHLAEMLGGQQICQSPEVTDVERLQGKHLLFIIQVCVYLPAGESWGLSLVYPCKLGCKDKTILLYIETQNAILLPSSFPILG